MALEGDRVHSHGSDVFVVKGCLVDDGLDLIAVSGSHTVQVISYVRNPSFPIITGGPLRPWFYSLPLVATSSRLFTSELQQQLLLGHPGHLLLFLGNLSI